jgi:uncharacterized membrane protein YgcG
MEVDAMLQIGIMIAIAAAMFWWLHLYVAIAGGVIILMLVAAKLRDAAHRGRRFVMAQDSEEDEAERIRQRDATFLYAMWIGLTVSGAAQAGDGGYSHHHGGDHGGDYGGGFDGGGGGGDGGGGGSL